MGASSEGDLNAEEGGENKEEVKEIIKAFLRKYRYLHEFRLQKLVYLVEIISKLERKSRITDADYKPYMYGVFSQDVRDVLSDLESDLPNEPDWQYGKTTTKFIGAKGGVPAEKFQHQENDIDYEWLDEVTEAIQTSTKGISSEDLGKWSKNSWLYENTQYDSEMDFSQLDSVDDRVRDELLEQFPKLSTVLSSQDESN
jgi:uncharacterized protein YwgA